MKVIWGLALVLGLAALPLGHSYAKDTGYLFVSSEKDANVTVLDGKTYQVVKKIKTSKRPRGMKFNSDHSLIYVGCGDGNSIDIIDVAKLEVTDRIKGVVEDPETFDLSPDGKLLYISLEDDAALGVIDIGQKKLVSKIDVGPEPEGVLTGPDGNVVYVTSEVANMVHVVDTAKHAVAANITVGNRPRRFALTPDRKELWVTNEISGTVSIIDPATNKVTATIEFKPKGFRREEVTVVGITMTRDGKTAFVALGRANHVAAVDVASREVQKYILVGSRPWNVTLNKDESLLYVTNGLSDDISVVDVAGLKVSKSVPVGRVPYEVVIDE
ncbi:MAG: PQQ-dependent catabolism-associated beta-propeller protein [Gammaproteobacteria bacterium]